MLAECLLCIVGFWTGPISHKILVNTPVLVFLRGFGFVVFFFFESPKVPNLQARGSLRKEPGNFSALLSSPLLSSYLLSPSEQTTPSIRSPLPAFASTNCKCSLVAQALGRSVSMQISLGVKVPGLQETWGQRSKLILEA